MEQINVYKLEEAVAGSPKANYFPAILTVLITAIFVIAGLYQITPPGVVPSTAPLTEFSSARARQHLEVIAQKPRPIGSLEHAKARDYILQRLVTLGLNPEVQKTTAISEIVGGAPRAATVENIIAKLKGTDNSKALMIAAHYDSVAVSPGASDCGAGVAAMLETLRAVKAGPALKNDVVFLFTDGEENGLFGSSAFMKEHAAAKDIGLVLNLEARGTGGPSIMFETSANNGLLIKDFADASPFPVANSLSYEIYKHLPNDTDLTVFEGAGLAGLNFAFIKGENHYHTMLDSIDNLDERSLQHHGSYTLSLARHFGNLSLDQTRQRNAVYFNALGPTLAHYSDFWVVPLMLLTLALLGAALLYGFKRKRLTISGIVLGFFAFLLTMIGVTLIVILTWRLINILHSKYGAVGGGELNNSGLYFVSFLALAVAITSTFHIWFRRKISLSNLTAGGLIWWGIFMAATGLLLPGGSYLFTWPLLFSMIALCFTFSLSDRNLYSMKHSAVLCICAAPGILLLAPMIYLVFLAMTLNMSWVLAVMVALLLGLLIPHLDIMTRPNKWLLPTSAALLSLGLIVGGGLTLALDKNTCKFNSVFYALNADSGQAVWAGLDQSVDEWTSQFFTEKIERGSLGWFIPFTYNGFMKSRAPAIPLDAPDMKLLSDTTTNGARVLRMRAASLRQAPVMILTVDSNTTVLGAIVNGKKINSLPRRHWEIKYYAVPKEGIDLTLEIKPAAPLQMWATDMSYGLPQIPGASYKPRPDHLLPSSFIYSDSTVVTKSYTF
jgi:hypothetical protein